MRDPAPADQGAVADAAPVDQGPDAAACPPEACNGLDDDCDGEVDEDADQRCGPSEAGTGICRAGIRACVDARLGDCAGAQRPLTEICDEVDNDCDGRVDEVDCAPCEPGTRQACFSGAPGEAGVGVCQAGEQRCGPSMRFGACEGEVPPADERCNGADDDCDGRTDEAVLDPEALCPVGVGACAREGRPRCTPDGLVCDGEPGAPTDEACNGLDDDCDGRVDEDFGVGQPCEVGVGACAVAGETACVEGEVACTAAAGEAAVEVCNGEDDDCDGVVDEPVPCYPGPDGTSGVGACRPGLAVCGAGCEGAVVPGPEACNGEDDDCDGAVDEGGQCRCTPGDTVACYEGPGAPDVGICRAGTRTCGQDHQFGACARQVGPMPETCDARDQDCDGAVDEGLDRACGSDVGRCRQGVQRCVGGGYGACEGEVTGRQEACNGVDDDCDGRTDEGLVRACGSSVGRCRQGQEACDGGGWGACQGETGPVAEACNGVDDDCDGRTDEGVQNACGDCGAVPEETCNGDDDDCDGRTDEGVQNACGACGRVPDEICNGADDDCDGQTDEGTLNACGQCGAVPAETCNGVDDDCDGSTDEALVRPCGTDVGVCTVGEQVCRDGVYGACSGRGPSGEDCNNADDDCDGTVDEGDGFELGCDLRSDTCVAGQCLCGGGPRCPISRECLNGRCIIIQ
ncbi:MAG: hypothetical protein H6706_02150 [Myxococcales bacterium]|nr:hypothetical protein [Myxococcales bacterium]